MAASPKSSELLLPRPALAGCLFAAIVRDTRGKALHDAERFNHFPASPLVALNIVLDGETRLVPVGGGLEAAKESEAIPAITVSGAHDNPVTSWNPGPVFAVSIGFYPEAWSALTGVPALYLANRTTAEVPAAFKGGLDARQRGADTGGFWTDFQDALEPRWLSAKSRSAVPGWRGGDRIADWSKSLISRAALSGPGRSLRAAERRLKRWSGQNRRSLSFFAAIESLHAGVAREGAGQLAGVALDAGFSDQSHMGRAVRRATGFSPRQLNRLIETEEAFWCYRLFGERF